MFKDNSPEDQASPSELKQNTIRTAWKEIKDLLPYITDDAFASRIEALCRRILRLTTDEKVRGDVARVLQALRSVETKNSKEKAPTVRNNLKTEMMSSSNITHAFHVAERPQETYNDIAGLNEAKRAIREMVELPLRHPEIFQHFGMDPPKGVLLYGPPGCGKTLLARAVANESAANFLLINGPECFDKFYGETEFKLREIFLQAQRLAVSTYSPSILFFDEFDALGQSRQGETSKLEDRVVSQLLVLMDGLLPLNGVSILAATNRLDLIDPALLRFGRFDRLIEVPLPNFEGRLEILKLYTAGIKLDYNVDLQSIATKTKGFSGAHLKGVCREAAWCAIRRLKPFEFKERIPLNILRNSIVTLDDIEEAIETSLKFAASSEKSSIGTPVTSWDIVVKPPSIHTQSKGG